MVAKVDGGEPEADTGNGVEAKTPFFVPAVEQEHVGGDGAMETGENVDTVTAVADHSGVPVGENIAGESYTEFVRHGEIGAGGRNESVTEESDAVDGEEAKVEALEERERPEEVFEHAEGEIGDEEHVAETERLGEKWADVRLKAKAKIFAGEGVVDAAECRVEKRAVMDDGDDVGHESIGKVHDNRIVKQAEAPGPLGSDARGEIDKEGGGEEEGKIEERESAGEAGRADETKPGDEQEELEDVFVREETAGRKRDSSARGLRSE